MDRQVQVQAQTQHKKISLKIFHLAIFIRAFFVFFNYFFCYEIYKTLKGIIYIFLILLKCELLPIYVSLFKTVTSAPSRQPPLHFFSYDGLFYIFLLKINKTHHHHSLYESRPCLGFWKIGCEKWVQRRRKQEGGGVKEGLLWKIIILKMETIMSFFLKRSLLCMLISSIFFVSQSILIALWSF